MDYSLSAGNSLFKSNETAADNEPSFFISIRACPMNLLSPGRERERDRWIDGGRGREVARPPFLLYGKRN